MDQGTQRLIRRHNAQMRDLIVRDIDALEEKLNVKRQVSNLTDNAVDTVKGKLGMNSNPNESWVDFFRHNAGPLAAFGLGGAVLAKNIQARTTAHTATTSSNGQAYYPPVREPYAEESSDGLRDKVGSKLSGVTETAGEGLDTAKGRVVDTGQAVGGKVVDAKDMVVDRIPSRGEAKQMARDHGQLLGAAALAVGAVAGVLVPRTQAEERRVAPLQSTVRDKASDLAEQGVDKVKETADRATEALSTGVEMAKEEFQESGADDASTTSTDLPTLTDPNRITNSRNGVTGTPSGTTSNV